MRISFDLDGVLSDFEENAARVANQLWPGKIPEGYVPTLWHWEDVLTSSEWDEIWTQIKLIPDFWIRQKPYEKNVQELRDFIAEFPDTRIFYVTARITTGLISARSQSKQWLENLGVYTKNSTVLISRPERKIEIMREARIEFSVDDKKETVAACQNVKGHQAYLFSQPWNQGGELPRVYSVKEYLDLVRFSPSCSTYPASSLLPAADPAPNSGLGT